MVSLFENFLQFSPSRAQRARLTHIKKRHSAARRVPCGCLGLDGLKVKTEFFFGFIQPGSSIAICAGNISGSPFALRWMKVFRKTIVLQFRSVFPDDPIVQNILFISTRAPRIS